MQLTKSDFLKFKDCSSSLWFYKNKPEILEEKEIDAFIQNLLNQGAEVEAWAQLKFPNGILVKSFHDTAINTTQNLIKSGKKTIFQATFSDNFLYASVDILEYNDLLDAWDIYEVKSSSSQVDSELGRSKNTYLDDLGFQRILLHKLGVRVANAYLVELNKDYTKSGPIDINELFTTTEVTDKLVELEATHIIEIEQAYTLINSTEEPIQCECKYKARKKHCAAFNYLYPEVPSYSIYDLNRIGSSRKLLRELVDKNELSISDISDTSKFKKMKLWQWHTHVNNSEIVLPDGIKTELSQLEYPLYFLDYETLASAIPKYDGTNPHQQVVIQYSLHIIESPGEEPIHKEYLHLSQESPMKAITDKLKEDIGNQGSILVWYKPFEIPRTKEMAAAVPQHQEFLNALISRVHDLMEVVVNGYYFHDEFKGSASIKAVLPVVCPDLSYKTLNVQNGGQAMATYKDLIFSNKYNANKVQIVTDLLEYCKLDTWAMLRIWQEFSKKALSN